jgi:uncharacterized tellurite resistance protein B-like protein
MEAIIGLFSVGFIIWIFWTIAKGSSDGSQHSDSSGPFNFSISEKVERRENFDFTCLDFSISGSISLSNQGNLAMMRLTLEVIDGEGKTWPVFTKLKDLSDNNGAFRFIEAIPLPYQHTVLKKPLSFLTVPKTALSFPVKGTFRLRAKFVIIERMHSGGSLKPVVATTSEIIISSEEFGYKDRAGHREMTGDVAVKLATLLSLADGSADQVEADVVKDYITQKISRSGSRKDAVKQRLNEAVHAAFVVAEETRRIPAAIGSLCKKCADFPLANKLEIVELLLRVTRADNVARQSEITLLEQIVRKMKVDFEEYKKLRDKLISTSVYEGGTNARSLLGITDDMSAAEIRKLLNNEYRKWNSLQNSSDAEVKTQAQKIIRLIAEERAKLRAK